MNAVVTMPQPTDLVDRALRDTDLIANFRYVADHCASVYLMIDQVRTTVVDALDEAMDAWRYDHRQPDAALLPIQYERVVRMLLESAWDAVELLERYEAEEIADAIEAGDFDREGNFIPYDSYHGGL